MPCTPNSASETYADFISRYDTTPQDFLAAAGTDCIDFVSNQFAVVHVPMDVGEDLMRSTFVYNSIPKLYSLLDLASMDASGILGARELPPLAGDGRGVMIGFIDTGIDYTNPIFRNKDGSTRILGIWDQTAGDGNLLPGNTFRPLYGTQYSREQIDLALASDDPLAIVPATDTNGHGTFLASVAAGGADDAAGFTGAAPSCYLGIVKLKPAKQYLREFFLIREDAEAYQENDIMMGITYLFALARQYRIPLVVCIGLGTNGGSHTGKSNLGLLLDELSGYNGTAFVIAAGNETGFAHHYRGTTTPDNNTNRVQIRVGERDRGFSMELWAGNIGVYTVELLSPSGDLLRASTARSDTAETLRFLLEGTEITVYSRVIANASESQVIFLRFQDPLPGIWTLIVTEATDISDTFHIWLPCNGFVSEDTRFLRPDPDTIVTSPGNAYYPITVGGFDHTTGSIYIHSSRGYSRGGQIKPDLAAPGVGILGASLTPGQYTRKTGTSAAAAHVAGAAAILLRWGVLEGNNYYMNSSTIKVYLLRGAQRNPALPYPNREFGYGTLDLYQAFLNLRI